MKLNEIPTPALVVDLDAMERNIRAMSDYYGARAAQLRPHFKAHKTPAIARRQLAAGNCSGVTCATIGEAEVVAREGISRDVLIANQLLGPGKAARAAALAKTIDLIVAVDSQQCVDDLAAAASSVGAEIGVLVDVNVGMPRCGVAPGEPAVALAKLVEGTAGLRLRGVMGYEGHAVGIADRPEREARARKAMDRLLSSAHMLRAAGLRCEVVSAGGTGTYDITGDMEGITEVQAGSYVLMDTAYAALDIPFDKALTLLCTVISRPVEERCVADGGLKAASTDHGNPELKGVIEGASVLYLADEHTVVSLPPGAAIAPGDSIEFWPSHIDPTINLHDVMYAVRDGEVVEIWPIAARGYVEHRAAAS